MSINIDQTDLRKQWFEDPDLEHGLMVALPMRLSSGTGPFLSYDGDWIKVTGVIAFYPALCTGCAYTSEESTGAGLAAQAFLKTDIDSECFMFFFEPFIGNFDNYQGLDTRAGVVHFARSRNAAAQTATDIDPQDWTVETRFGILHEFDQSDVYFYIDGVEQAHHNANISAQPYEICCAEPRAVVREIEMKYPPGMAFLK